MIEKCPGYKVGETFFPTLIQAQLESIKAIIRNSQMPVGNPDDVADFIFQNGPELTSILKPSKELLQRARRKDFGAKRGPKPTTPKPEEA